MTRLVDVYLCSARVIDRRAFWVHMPTIVMKERQAPCSLCLALELQSFEVAWGPAWRALPWCRIYPISIREEHFTERRLQSKTAGIEICTDCMNLQLGRSRSHARNFRVKKYDNVTCFVTLFQVTFLVTVRWLVFWTSDLVHLFIRYDLDPILSG